jgi:hypothetical protein
MWLPREAVHVSLQFLLNDVPEVPSGVIWKFIRDINRVRLSCHVGPNLSALLHQYTQPHEHCTL